jgi:hypothetical protein
VLTLATNSVPARGVWGGRERGGQGARGGSRGRGESHSRRSNSNDNVENEGGDYLEGIDNRVESRVPLQSLDVNALHIERGIPSIRGRGQGRGLERGRGRERAQKGVEFAAIHL